MPRNHPPRTSVPASPGSNPAGPTCAAAPRRALGALVCATAGLFTVLEPSTARGDAPPARQPNIVVVVADDLGWTSLGTYGGRHVSTPAIDRLAAQGMRFTRAYVTPQCTPTRATLLTGQYTARNGMWHVLDSYHHPYARLREPPHVENLPRTTPILPKVMRDAGYTTALVGKWHLHSWTDGHYDMLFEPFAGVHGFDTVAPSYADIARAGGRTQDKAVDLHTEAAVRFVREARQPYFLWVGFHPVHGPLRAPPELVNAWVERGYPSDTGAADSAAYFAMLENLDRAVGRLDEAVTASGQGDNTVFVFVSDNGGVNAAYPNAPLRQGKGSPYEGGIRVPLIVRWPGAIPAGSVCDEPVHAVDLYPTLAAFAGAHAPEHHTLDGASLEPVLRGRDAAWSRGEPLYFYQPLYDAAWRATPSAAVIDGDWKLIEFFGDYVDVEGGDRYEPFGRVELYNLAADIGERRNLAQEQPERARELQHRLHRWLERVEAPLPSFNPRYDPTRLWEREGGQWFSNGRASRLPAPVPNGSDVAGSPR